MTYLLSELCVAICLCLMEPNSSHNSVTGLGPNLTPVSAEYQRAALAFSSMRQIDETMNHVLGH